MKKCTHPDEHQITILKGYCFVLEYTQVKCLKCGEFLTKPELWW